MFYAHNFFGLAFGFPVVVAGTVIAFVASEINRVQCDEHKNEKEQQVNKPCPECDGTGFDSAISDNCLACNGTGVYSGEDFDHTCPVCFGSGIDDYTMAPCEFCKGKGEV